MSGCVVCWAAWTCSEQPARTPSRWVLTRAAPCCSPCSCAAIHEKHVVSRCFQCSACCESCREGASSDFLVQSEQSTVRAGSLQQHTHKETARLLHAAATAAPTCSICVCSHFGAGRQPAGRICPLPRAATALSGQHGVKNTVAGCGACTRSSERGSQPYVYFSPSVFMTINVMRSMCIIKQ